MRWHRIVPLAVLWLLMLRLAGSQEVNALPALRAAVPLLCTENHQAARTRVRGTGVIADSGGTLLTAAHVIQEAHSDCALSVMIPDDEWSRFGRLHAFLLKDCTLFAPLDLAICRIRPADSNRDWGYIRPARIHARAPVVGEAITITAFTGWGLSPLVRSGHVQGRQTYQRKDGCYCDFATDIPASEGMSGSPVISAQGEVLGIVTLAGKGQFRSLSFGASLQEAASFLKSEGVPLVGDGNRLVP
ncbi:MAG TPA: serine protease [Terriglobales bacterium]|jgi:S1-C subfamily serine protease|nr:serine protease [Terriglobales bacterium]